MSDYDNQREPGDVTVHSKTPNSNLDHPDRQTGRPVRTGPLDDIASSVKEFASKLPAQRHIDQLVEAGIFKNRSDSAAYLITEGIRARQDVFSRINSRFEEIERIRGEMRRLVTEPADPSDVGPGSS